MKYILQIESNNQTIKQSNSKSSKSRMKRPWHKGIYSNKTIKRCFKIIDMDWINVQGQEQEQGQGQGQETTNKSLASTILVCSVSKKSYTYIENNSQLKLEKYHGMDWKTHVRTGNKGEYKDFQRYKKERKGKGKGTTKIQRWTNTKIRLDC